MKIFFRLSEPSVIVHSCETVYPPLLLTTKSLAAPAFDISQDQLVHKVMYTKILRLPDFCQKIEFWSFKCKKQNCYISNSIPLVGNTHFYFKTVVAVREKKLIRKVSMWRSVKSQGIKNLYREIVQIYLRLSKYNTYCWSCIAMVHVNCLWLVWDLMRGSSVPRHCKYPIALICHQTDIILFWKTNVAEVGLRFWRDF